ncbi:MAG: ATP-binding protein involved in chromosome partitioning, partial [Flavobacteriales bacterium]
VSSAPSNAIKGVKQIIAVASGKGGVGKSTVTSNLALGLKNKGYKVAIVDADVYGPSIPIMFNVADERPASVPVEGSNKMLPVIGYGIQIMSLGFFAEPDQPIVWRGAMVSKALKQMFFETEWDDVDYMLVDLPPGTGDIHLSLVQSTPVSSAIMVTTPQDVAIADVRKGVAMFKMPNVNVPVLGIIENMSWFTPEELPENKYYIFGKNGGAVLAEKLNLPLLGQIPLVQSVREAGDAGRPAILQSDTEISKDLVKLVDEVILHQDKRIKELPETKVVQMTK